MTVTIDSRIYNDSFYGILNANGAFWTPLAFESEAKAWDHLRNFWRASDREWQGRRSQFKVVPVHIQLTSLAPASVGRNAKRQDPQGLGPKDEHAVTAQPADAQPEGPLP